MADRSDLAIVLFGDVVASRSVARAADWLRSLRAELDGVYGAARLAPFQFTQGDELQGLLHPGADPFEAVVRAALRPDRLPMRWVIVAGEVERGRGPATQRTGPAFLVARELAGLNRRRRDDVTAQTGDPGTDRLLVDIAPVLGRLLGELTPRQRSVARLVLVEGLRQAEVAKRLGVRPPTVSVAADRARVKEIGRLHDASRRLLAMGIEATHGVVPAKPDR